MTTPNSSTAKATLATIQQAGNVSSAPATDEKNWIQPSLDARMAYAQFEIIDKVYAAVYVEPLPPLTELHPNIEDELRAMANDPNILRELREIALEFRSADADGLIHLP